MQKLQAQTLCEEQQSAPGSKAGKWWRAGWRNGGVMRVEANQGFTLALEKMWGERKANRVKEKEHNNWDTSPKKVELLGLETDNINKENTSWMRKDNWKTNMKNTKNFNAKGHEVRHCEGIFFSHWLLSKIFNKLNEKYQVSVENEKEKEECN